MRRETSTPLAPSWRRSIVRLSLRHDARGASAVSRCSSRMPGAAGACRATCRSSAVRSRGACLAAPTYHRRPPPGHVHAESTDESTRVPALGERTASAARGLAARRRPGHVKGHDAQRDSPRPHDAVGPSRPNARGRLLGHRLAAVALAAAADAPGPHRSFSPRRAARHVLPAARLGRASWLGQRSAGGDPRRVGGNSGGRLRPACAGSRKA